MMGMQSKKCLISLNGKSLELFSIHDFSEELSVFKNAVSAQNCVHFDRCKVLKFFRRLKERKSPSPDGIGDHILKNCAEKLADILFYF